MPRLVEQGANVRVRTPVEAQEAARLLLVHGRWFCHLTPHRVKRGVRCILNSPAYREQVYAAASARARSTGRGLLLLELMDAMDVLALNDTEEA